MKHGLLRARLVVWWLLLLILLTALLAAWRAVWVDTAQTAIDITRLRMIERANLYKQQWLLQGRPNRLPIEQDQIVIQHGWVFPKREQTVDCEAVLSLLYPQRTLLNQWPRVTGIDLADGYRCHYQYGEREYIEVELNGRHFAVDIKLLM
ncbi:MULTISPECIES: MSHA biogenesis protein MshF [Vibrio]|uniref:MSHA biogenesis protein MshF n=1 Tax=Vibrio chanodichtyis TaxID=3027932 RepID=A0ABT5V3T0_9VIBR|nr:MULTISPECIES: MSHA biogenesis protein MshF [Vibrio]MDE1515807.1 MSHA biogenesis protein MshF [Vibrio chanodichtyis]